MTSPVSLQRRYAWRHSLRFRLALMYTLLALALVAIVGVAMTVQLLRDLDTQFQTRLDERADTLAQAQNNPGRDLGVSLPTPSGSYSMLVDGSGRVLVGTPGVRQFEKSDFPFRSQVHVPLAGVTVRTVTRPLKGGGFVWVGLAEDTLIQARQSAYRLLMFALLLTPLLTLLLAWFAGKRALRGLGEAAVLARRLDPASSVTALPLPRRRDEVYELLAALNLLLSRIDQQQAREKQLLGQIVHELGAPLTVLKASLARAESRSDDPEVRRAALVADELTTTTSDLMQLARGQLEVVLAWHFIPARTLRGRLDRLVAGTEFLGDWEGMILCDPDRLTQALRNLLANARRAAGLEGHVSITLQETPGELRFTVQDDGPGLPGDLGSRIFDPFVSGAGSSGLGLSVSRQIAQLHGGDLTGGNRPDGGARFVLTLPGAEVEENEPELEGEPEVAQPVGSAAQAAGHINPD